MENNSNISVIMRTKNEERWIGHSIQSVLELITKPEIIVIDNMSEDRTIEIVKHFQQDPELNSEKSSNYTNIKIHYIKDYSPGKSLNLGVKCSSNDYILTLSSHCVVKKFNKVKHIKDLENHLCIFGNQIPIWEGKKINKRYISLPEWKIEDITNDFVTIDDITTNLQYYQAQFRIKIRRRHSIYICNIGLWMFLISLLAFVGFSIDKDNYADRLHYLIALLLTGVGFRWII